MTAAKFRSILAELGLTQERAAELLGRTGRSARRWVANKPPPEVAIIFELLRSGVISIDDIKTVRDRVCDLPSSRKHS